MKAILLSSVIVLSLAVCATAADPKKKGKEPKAEKVSARDMLAKYDKDSDRKLDKMELSSALRSLKYNTVSTKNDSWKKFDTDSDTKIDQGELDKLLEANVPPPEDPKAAEEKAKEPPKGKLSLTPQR